MTATDNAKLEAFPVVIDAERGDYSPGLTKREMLAAMAMQGVMFHADFANCGPEPVAAAAVELADALLAELAKEPPK